MKLTARQFLELGEDPPGVRLELVDGQLAVTPSQMPIHGYATLRLGSSLLRFVDKHDLGRIYSGINTILGEHDVRRPDLLYFKKTRLHLIGEKAMEGSPDLCIEVLSPSSQKIDRQDKFEQYAKSRVPFYWILDPKKQTIQGYVLSRGKYTLSGEAKQKEAITLPPFKDLRIKLSEIWQPARS